MSRGQHSVLQTALGRLALGKEGGRQMKGSPRGELALGQAAYNSASAMLCPHMLQTWMGPVGVHCWVSVPQRGVSEEMLDVKALQTEAVKHLDCDNMTYLKTGTRSESLFVEGLVVVFFPCSALQKLRESGKCCKQLSFCGPHLRDPLTEGLLISTKHTCCSKSVFGLTGVGQIGGFRAIWI